MDYLRNLSLGAGFLNIFSNYVKIVFNFYKKIEYKCAQFLVIYE